MGTFVHVTALWFYWNGNRNSNRTHCLSLIIRNFLLLTVSFIEECTGCSSVHVFLVLVWRCPGFGWDTVNVLSTLQLQSEIKLLQVKDNNEFCAVKTLPFLKEVMDHIRKRPILPSQKPIKQQVKKIYPLTKNLNQILSVQLHCVVQMIRNNNITHLLVYASLAVLINSGQRQYLFLSSWDNRLLIDLGANSQGYVSHKKWLCGLKFIIDPVSTHSGGSYI